jgi:hypothetical protein
MSMLSLDSPRWSELQHAYGSASNIPLLLKQLETFPSDNPNDEPWFSIWSALAHQGDVYSASFAAIPAVVSIIESNPQKATASFFQFPTWVEICRQRKHVPIPDDLRPGYFEALARLGPLSATVVNSNSDEGFLRCLLASIAVSKAEIALAEAILELEPDVVPEFMTWLEAR